jgi:hypothetical protein
MELFTWYDSTQYLCYRTLINNFIWLDMALLHIRELTDTSYINFTVNTLLFTLLFNFIYHFVFYVRIGVEYVYTLLVKIQICGGLDVVLIHN